uniref:Uncharacterized protein n=1 Tax=Rhizophora mucronata TaxID=61149 RepID=A0A2P2N8U2_RHIMU
MVLLLKFLLGFPPIQPSLSLSWGIFRLSMEVSQNLFTILCNIIEDLTFKQ